jgi:hypothetical protein
MYQLALCDLFHPLKYGYTSTSSTEIMGQFFVYAILESEEFFDEREMIESYENRLWDLQCNFGELSHPFIRNYSHYILSKKYNNTEIVEIQELAGGEFVAILKTLWISIIQRRWKYIMQKRQQVLQMRKMPTAILYRETHGQWPSYCSRWPLFTLNIA